MAINQGLRVSFQPDHDGRPMLCSFDRSNPIYEIYVIIYTDVQK